MNTQTCLVAWRANEAAKRNADIEDSSRLMDITLSNAGPRTIRYLPENSKPVKWIVLHGVESRKAYGWCPWQTNDGHQKCYFCLGGSQSRRPRIYKWTGETVSGWSCRNSNNYRSPEGLDAQGLWEKYGRRD